MADAIAGSSSSHMQIDPSLHRLASSLSDIPIDPALFELEGFVNDVRRGKVKLDDPLEPPEPVLAEENEIDPALREIVNSLTNAQQSSTAPGMMSQAQATAAIHAHMADNEDRDKLQQSLEELTQASYGAFFPAPFPSPPPTFEGLPTSPRLSPPPVVPSELVPPKPRGRGRPPGSKNKPKPKPPPKPKAPKPPPKPRGRPPKVRTAEELAEIEQRREEKALGIKRQKGRPRKFPGFLVREMRLKRNRAEFHEVQRRFEQGLPLDDIEMKPPPEVSATDGQMGGDAGEEGHDHAHELDPELEKHDLDHSHDMAQEHGSEHEHEHGTEDLYGWPSDDQALLDAVGAARMADDGPIGLDDKGGDSGIHEMFGLNAVAEEEPSASSFR